MAGSFEMHAEHPEFRPERTDHEGRAFEHLPDAPSTLELSSKTATFCLQMAPINGSYRGGPYMAKCEVCGNDYDKSFDVIAAGQRHTFDSFECAISALAPQCEHCKCRVIGHGVEAAGRIFCCANCARIAGVGNIQDRS
jgi:hypothetical protein